jgi:hypothetical protein
VRERKRKRERKLRGEERNFSCLPETRYLNISKLNR